VIDYVNMFVVERDILLSLQRGAKSFLYFIVPLFLSL